MTDFAAIALAKYDEDPGVYIFYCDPDWSVITDTVHRDLVDAEEQAHLEFEGIAFVEVSRG